MNAAEPQVAQHQRVLDVAEECLRFFQLARAVHGAALRGEVVFQGKPNRVFVIHDQNVRPHRCGSVSFDLRQRCCSVGGQGKRGARCGKTPNCLC